MLEMTMSPVMVQVQLQVSGGATQSVFPKVDEWLNEDSDRQHALEYVARKKVMGRYHSMVDFLFCEIFIEFQWACFRFYDGKGPALKDSAEFDESKREQWERRLLAGLHLACEIYKEKRRKSWTVFRTEVLELQLNAA